MFSVLKMIPISQIGDIEELIEKQAIKCNLLDAERRKAEGISTQWANRLAPGESSKIREVIWELIIQRILTPGSNDHNPNLPFIRLTDWGRECVNAEKIVPYDRNGYLTRLKEVCPNLDSLAEKYVIEALECFRRGCFFAAPVMLGCASEKIIVQLMETFENAIQDPDKKRRFERRMKDISIKSRFDYFRTEFSRVRNIPPKLTDAIEIQLDGVFTLLRYARNDVGHPTGKEISRDEIFVSFGLFISYCERVNALIDWLKNNLV